MKGKGTLTDGWDKAIEDIHALGAEYMVCAFLFPNERTPEIYKSLPAMFEKAASATKAAGIQFAYHNHDFEFEKLDDTLVYDFLLKNTSPDLVKMEMDLYWISKAGYDPVQYFEKYPGRFHMWHVKDMEAETKAITEVGNGTIDFDRIFAARKKAGLKHWFVEQDTSKRDKFESLKISRDYLAKKNY
jgi:sugar phosphate isomerase/epimerase